MYTVLQLFNSFHQGGTERQTVQLTRLLHESGRYRLRLACIDPGGPLRADIERLGISDIPSFPLTSFYDRNMVVQLRRFVAYLRENEIDLIHAHDFYTNIFGMIGATLARVPVRLVSRRETDGIRSRAQRWVERRAYGVAHVVVANAEAVRRQVIAEGIAPEKVVRVYNGLDMSRFATRPGLSRDERLALLNLPRDEENPRRFVTIIANMRHPMKDQGTFLRAARRVRAVVPDAAFVLAGEGDLTEGWRALAAELGLARDAFFLGRCMEVAELLAVSDVCVLSSKGVEGLSNSIIEYMAAARPVVATDIGGASECVIEGETGHVVQPEDDATMAERIISLLQQPARARAMGARGREVAAQKFSLAARLAATEKLYDRLLIERAVVDPPPASPRRVGDARRNAD